MKNKVLVVLAFVLQLTAQQLTYRLPRDVLPKHYSLKLHPNMEDNTFQGEVTITLYSNKESENFLLHSTGLNVTYASVNQLPANVEKEDPHERISIRFPGDLNFQPGEHQVHLKFKGRFQEHFGLRKASYRSNASKGFLVVNEFEANHARRAFPCFDEPVFKARFNIRLVTPNDTYRAISNMPEIARYPAAGGVIYDFATSVPMSTYLVSLAITDYPFYEELFEYDNKTIPIRVYTYNASKENNQFAIDSAKVAIQFYTDYTGIEYPLPKLDMIEYDKGEISATETWGLIQFKQGLLTPSLNSYDTWQCSVVMFHELGHFWFGNLVTNDWWNDLWLQEGFATFMSYKLMTKQDKKDDLMQIRLTEILENQESASLPQLVAYLKSAKYIEKRFDKIVYEKGASLLKALEILIGENAFRQAIKNFLKKHAFQTATTNDLVSEFEDQVKNMNVRSFVESYLYQPDYPVVNVEDHSEKYVLRQFQKEGSSFSWTIPISYRYENGTTGLIWLDRDIEYVELEKSTNSDWILFNTVKMPGIYVVNYTEALWTSLISNINDFSPSEVRHFEDNVGVLYDLKHINCHIVLQLVGNVSSDLAVLFKASIDVARRIACFEPEYSVLVKYLDQKFEKVDLWLQLFNATCEHKGNSTTKKIDQHALECSQWIGRNLGNSIIS